MALPLWCAERERTRLKRWVFRRPQNTRVITQRFLCENGNARSEFMQREFKVKVKEFKTQLRVSISENYTEADTARLEERQE